MNALIPPSFIVRRMAIVATLLAALLLPSANALAGDVEEVRATDLRRIRALIHADRAELEAVLADDLTYGHADGRMQTKPDLLTALTSGAVTYQSYDGPSPSVRIQDNMALLTGVAELQATARGSRVKLWLRYLAVYVKRDGAWRLTAYQSSRLEQPPDGFR